MERSIWINLKGDYLKRKEETNMCKAKKGLLVILIIGSLLIVSIPRVLGWTSGGISPIGRPVD